MTGRAFFKTRNFSGSSPVIKSFRDGFHKAALNPARGASSALYRRGRRRHPPSGRGKKILFLIPVKRAGEVPRGAVLGKRNNSKEIS